MTTQIDFRTLPANVPVLCIPRVYPNISESRIRRIFDDLNMGVLEHIDIVSKNTAKDDKGEKFNRVFVHFRRWNDTENANIARERLLNGKEIKIIYDDPWFWKISAYRETERKSFAPQNAGQCKPILQFDSDEDRAASNSKHVISSYRHQDYNRPARRRPDERRQDDNRPARRRPDERRQDDNIPARRRPDERRQDDNIPARRRPDERRRENITQDDKKPFHELSTPSCSPPRERHLEKDDNAILGLKIDYGNVKPPMRKKKINVQADEDTKKTEDQNEDGEVLENV